MAYNSTIMETADLDSLKKSFAGGEWGQAAADFLHYCVTNIKLHHEIETSSRTREKLTFFLMHIEGKIMLFI